MTNFRLAMQEREMEISTSKRAYFLERLSTQLPLKNHLIEYPYCLCHTISP